MPIPNRTKLQELFAEMRRIEEHRSAKAEVQIMKTYKEMLKDLNSFFGREYAKYGKDDVLTYSMLAQKSQYARFLEEAQQTVDLKFKRVYELIDKRVKQAYEEAYKGMVNAVANSINNEDLKKRLQGIELTPAEVIKAAVTNPVNKLTLPKTLEKARKQIVHNIKSTITNGLMNGDRMSTMASKIQEDVNMNYRKAMLIARTEVHRVRETGHNDASGDIDNTLADAGSDFRMVKIWKSMRDSSVRKTNKADHRAMEGQTVLQDEDFDLGRGVKAPCPGQSGTAYNDCNCRCYVSHDLMSDDEFFQKTGKHFPKKEEPKKKSKKEEQKQTTPVAEPNGSNKPPQAKTKKEADKILQEQVGFKNVDTRGANKLNQDLYIKNANQLARLENKFRAVHKSDSEIVVYNKAGANAFVSSNQTEPTRQNMNLGLYYYEKDKTTEEFIKHKIEQMKNNYSMPFDEKYAEVYTITHEYGHMVQNTIIMDEMKIRGYDINNPMKYVDMEKANSKNKFVRQEAYKWYKDISTEVENQCKSEIEEIAIGINPNADLLKISSEYSRTNKREWFAEVFANSQLGKPNVLGEAMNIWLERKGLIKL